MPSITVRRTDATGLRQGAIYGFAMLGCWMATPSCWALPSAPASLPTASPSATTNSATTNGSNQPSTFPVGINVNNRNVIPSVLVRGREDGTKALDFDHWLVPYDTVIQVLNLDVKTLPEGQVEMRSPGVVTRIDLKTLLTDPELGLVFSIQDLKSRFGVEAKFDLINYAIELQVPWVNQPGQSFELTTLPLQLEGLPQIKPSRATLSTLQQQVNISGSQREVPSYQGDLTAVGHLFGGSWFVKMNQQDLANPASWSLANAQLLRQTNTADYLLGSQQPFWLGNSSGDYVGFTTIQRYNFSPPQQFYDGPPDLRQRLAATQLGRTISGRAAPGTLVQLKQGFGDRVIAEQLVDSSGIYRFDHIKIDTQFQYGNYRLFLYPLGRLTATPQIREVTFTPITGQLPAGASALIASVGLNRQLSGSTPPSFLGTFSDIRGGLARRWGVSDDLTLGLGAVYDEAPRGLAELFYQPSGIPMTAALSVLTGKKGLPFSINGNIQLKPWSNLTAILSTDEFSSRVDLNWRVTQNMALMGNLDSTAPAAVGAQLSFGGSHSFTAVGATIDLNKNLRWNLYQRLNRLELSGFGNETGLNASLSYALSSAQDLTTGHSLFLGYESVNLEPHGNLAQVGWRYRSPQQAQDGGYRWDISFGYAIGSQGSGVLASLQTSIVPGVLIRGSYSGASTTAREATFRLELVSSLEFQGGVHPGDRRADYFRTQGGIVIQPFFDNNHNHQREGNEKTYTDPNLVMINNKTLQFYSADLKPSQITLRLLPGTYRLDLDPAGFPLDWQPEEDAYAVEVSAGSYTVVKIPLRRSYIVSGIVKNREGQPVGGAKVEALSQSSGQRVFSITNGAGVYYLERLQAGAYSLSINGTPAQPNIIEFNQTSEAYQELNLQK